MGFYSDPTSGLYHGYLNDYYAGTFTSIDCSNATQTVAYGINNAGSVVGIYYDQTGAHGFLYQVGICTGFDVPGATSTYAFGVNDDTQISGYYSDSVGGAHGFLYQPGNPVPFTSFDYPGATTNAYGINGDAQIAGGCPNPGTAFLYFGGTFSNPPLDCAVGVNNNEQITGSFGGSNVFEHETNYVITMCPGASSTNSVYSSSDFIYSPPNQAKVAFVGICFVSGVGHGFLATSQ